MFGRMLGRMISAGDLAPPAFNPSDARLSWERPAVTNEVVFNVGPGFWSPDGAALGSGQSNPTTGGTTRPTRASLVGKDVRLVLPASARTADLNLNGFTGDDLPRSLTIIGGDLGPGRLIGQAAEFIYIQGTTQALTAAKDAMNLSAPADSTKRPDVYIQKCRISGLRGTNAGTHSDALQPQGHVRRVRRDLCVIDSNYQGDFLAPQYEMEERDIRRTHYFYNTVSGNDPVTSLLWLNDTDSDAGADLGKRFVPTKLTEVYITPRAGQTLAQHAVNPKTGDTINGVNVGAIADANGNASWPSVTLITGMVKVGPPPQDYAAGAGTSWTYPSSYQGV